MIHHNHDMEDHINYYDIRYSYKYCTSLIACSYVLYKCNVSYQFLDIGLCNQLLMKHKRYKHVHSWKYSRHLPIEIKYSNG